MKEIWRVNIPQLFTLPDFSLDDAGTDDSGAVYVTDSINCCVYKFAPNSIPMGTFSVNCLPSSGEEASLMNLAVNPGSDFLVTDAANGLVLKYDEMGFEQNQYWTPGVITLCGNDCGYLYTLSAPGGIERIDRFDPEGNLEDVLPAPNRERSPIDASLLKMDADADGNVYLTDGMPPYRIWKILPDGSGIEAFGRYVDYVEETILVTDIGIDPISGNLYSLLAYKHGGQQILDCFSPEGKFLGSTGVPHNETMYSVMCPAGEAGFYFLDNSTGPGAGELMRAELEQDQ